MLRSVVPVSGGQLPFTAGAWLICQAVVLEDGLFAGRWQLAVGADRGRILHLLPVVSDLEVSGTYGRLGQGNEHQPVPGRGIPTVTVPNAGRSVLVSTWTASSSPIL